MHSHSHRVGIRTCSDYSPFGVELDGRTVSGGYRFGFNGMEGDDEVKGGGNSYATEFRHLDPRLGRWLSVDALAFQFSSISPYNFCLNSPVFFIDSDGKAPGPPKNVHYYNMVKQSNGTYKPIYSHSNYDLVIKTTNATFTSSFSGSKWGLIKGNHGKQDQTTNVLTYWNADGGIKSQIVRGSDLDSQINGQRTENMDTKSKNEQYPGKPKPKIGETQDLELHIEGASVSVGVGAFGAEVDLVGWQYYSISSGQGWKEEGSIKMHDYALLDVGSGVSLRPGVGVELLSIGGGTLSIQGEYLKKHPTTSLINLLNNRNIITIFGGFGYKYTTFDIFSDENELIAKGSVHSLTISTPSVGGRQGKTKFE